MNGYKLSRRAAAAATKQAMVARGLSVVASKPDVPVPHAPVERAEPRMTIHDTAVYLARPQRRAPFVPADDVYALPAPPPGVLRARPNVSNLAMDYAPQQVQTMQNWAISGAFHEGQAFLGYPYLAELSQRAEYRRIAEIWAEHATRRFVKLRGPDEAKLTEIEQFLEDGLTDEDGTVRGGLHARAAFREAAELDGIFGRSHLYLDFDRPREVGKPLMIDKRKIGPTMPVRALKVLEPMWLYPGGYEAANPLSQAFYKPQIWYVYGQTVHDSRLLTFVGAEVPDVLKPSYAFGGVSRVQQAKPYVDNWLTQRQSTSDITSAFSQMVLKTDMSQVLSGGAGEMLYARLDMFNATRDNRGVMALDKDAEEFENVSAPLSGLDKLTSQALEFTAAAARIPLSIYLQITPTGLNASSEGETRSFYADVKAYQERSFRPNFARLLDVVCLSLYSKTAGQMGVTFEFPDLWETSDVDRATIRKTDAETAVAYVGAGIIGPDEERERLSEDEQGHYRAIDTGRDVVGEQDDREIEKNDAMTPEPDPNNDPNA